MLKKIYRISKTRELNRVHRLGKTAHSSALVIKFVPGEKVRTAFIVSKKVSKKAVERNRNKRALREEIRLSINDLPKGEYMVLAKSLTSKLSNSEIRKELQKSIAKIPAMKNQSPNFSERNFRPNSSPKLSNVK